MRVNPFDASFDNVIVYWHFIGFKKEVVEIVIETNANFAIKRFQNQANAKDMKESIPVRNHLSVRSALALSTRRILWKYTCASIPEINHIHVRFVKWGSHKMETSELILCAPISSPPLKLRIPVS